MGLNVEMGTACGSPSGVMGLQTVPQARTKLTVVSSFFKLLYPPPLDLFNKADWKTLIRIWFPKKKNLENNKWNADIFFERLMPSHSRPDKISFWSLFCCIFCFIAHKIFAKGGRSGLQVGQFFIWTTGTLHCLAEMSKTKDFSGKDIISMEALCCLKAEYTIKH